MAIPTITTPKIVLKNGRPAEVILRWRDFQELLEKLEDVFDLAEIKRIKKQKPAFRNFEPLLKDCAL